MKQKVLDRVRFPWVFRLKLSLNTTSIIILIRFGLILVLKLRFSIKFPFWGNFPENSHFHWEIVFFNRNQLIFLRMTFSPTIIHWFSIPNSSKSHPMTIWPRKLTKHRCGSTMAVLHAIRSMNPWPRWRYACFLYINMISLYFSSLFMGLWGFCDDFWLFWGFSFKRVIFPLRPLENGSKSNMITLARSIPLDRALGAFYSSLIQLPKCEKAHFDWDFTNNPKWEYFPYYFLDSPLRSLF